MDQPTIKLRIAAHPVLENDVIDPLVEVVAVETVVNSTPAINAALREFVARNRPVRFGKVSFRRV
jgi:hypothetical protein